MLFAPAAVNWNGGLPLEDILAVEIPLNIAFFLVAFFATTSKSPGKQPLP